MRVLVIGALAIVLAGCNGGTVDRHALTNDAATLDSIACEGALVAHDVAHGRTTSIFTRVQAEELGLQASNLADALSERPALASIEQQARARARDAAALASTLGRLHDDPSNRVTGADVERTLRRMGHCP